MNSTTVAHAQGASTYVYPSEEVPALGRVVSTAVQHVLRQMERHFYRPDSKKFREARWFLDGCGRESGQRKLQGQLLPLLSNIGC